MHNRGFSLFVYKFAAYQKTNLSNCVSFLSLFSWSGSSQNTFWIAVYILNWQKNKVYFSGGTIWKHCSSLISSVDGGIRFVTTVLKSELAQNGCSLYTSNVISYKCLEDVHFALIQNNIFVISWKLFSFLLFSSIRLLKLIIT